LQYKMHLMPGVLWSLHDCANFLLRNCT